MAEETSSQLPDMGGLTVEEVAENEATLQEKPLEERISYHMPLLVTLGW